MENGYLPFPKGFATAAIHAAQEPEQWSCMEVVTPISMSTTFKQDDTGNSKYLYGRCGNPTRDVLEKVIATLECGKYCACSSSGLGAITTILGLLQQGDHLVCINDVYGGTYSLLSKVATKYGIEISFSDVDVSSLEKTLKLNTKMVFVESPTNPTIQMCDIEALAKITKKRNIILVVDNTFLTAYLQRPLTLGADIVMYSLTKYMNGHTDVVMGAIITKDDKLTQQIKFLQTVMGIVPSPFDCYQVLRSLKTLPLRMNQHSQSSLTIAKHLEKHPKVEKVIHPGLPSHPQHQLAKKQTSGLSGMLSMYIKGNLESTQKFLQALKIFTIGGSLGGCESLAEMPILISHASIPLELKEKLGITDNFVRISIGLEDTEDLVADLEQALNVI